eukprot:TRINITY_DN8175_c0_g1_i1.p1 TRINITY_DN8175_c0_g1~~TRINITY_DN8175_c0_g1_i1.p1  ORF type:complete len:811 (+),score=341.95 TRINITY_DN8175_c0_g1_i1:142-2574(+)
MAAGGGLPDLVVCSTEKRARLMGLIKGYYHQLTVGCGEADCPNRSCKASPGFELFGKPDTELYNEAKKLARGAFREPEPIFYFCGAYCYPTRAVATNPLAVQGATAEALRDGIESLDAAPWMFYDIALARGQQDVYARGGDAGKETTASLVHGGALGFDLPAVRKDLRTLATGSAMDSFEAALKTLIDKLLESAKDTSDGGDDSEYAQALKAEQAQVAETYGKPAERRRLLNTFLTYRLTRLLVLLLECPTVTEGAGLLQGVCTTVAALYPYLSAPLIEVYANYDPDSLQALVASLQTYITLCLFREDYAAGDGPVQNIPGACVMLSILFEANYALSTDGIIPYAAFYNDAVNEHVNSKSDFDRWNMNADPPTDEQLAVRPLRDVFLHEARLGRAAASSAANFTFVRYPFLLNAAYKHSILQLHSADLQNFEMSRAAHRSIMNYGVGAVVTVDQVYLILNIDRHDLLSTTMSALNRARDKIRRPLRVQFKNEEGIDEGGVKKEFFQMVIRQLLDPSFGMFTENEQHIHWFQPRIMCSHNDIEFMLIGKIIGLAIYNNVILDINFPPIAFKKLLNIESTFDDLRDLDVELYNGLRKLLEFDEEKEGALVEDVFCRTFTASHEVFGEQQEVELKPGGAEVVLTAQNREEYVDLYTKYVCDTSIGKNFQEFKDGFFMVCGAQADVLKTFHPKELEEMVVGCAEYNLTELEETTRYDGYKEDDQTVKDFWSIIQEMGREEQRMFLKFCTGTDRLPIRGLKSLGFVVGKNGGDSEQLPTAHTCFNHLLIPDYGNREKLKEKLLHAIRNCQGFGLM